MSRVPLPPEFAAFTVAEGAAAGLGRGRLRGRDLHAPFHGVRSTDLNPSLRTLCVAYAARMPRHAFFCGPTAARLWGVPLPRRLEVDSPLHVGVPAPRRAPAGAGIVGHSVQVRGGEVRQREGVRVSSPERLWCELGAALAVPDLVAAGDFLVRRAHPLTSIAKLRSATTAHGSGRGIRRLRAALPYLSERSASRPESLLRVIALQGNIEGLVANLRITTTEGYDYVADLAVPARRAIIEYQSNYHADVAQFRADMTRRARLEADGWRVILVNWDDLADERELVARLKRALAR